MGKKRKRIGIFVYYDYEGIVDDYVLYFLQNLIENLDKLVIVVNGRILEDEKRKLEEFTRYIFVRENRGLDAAAWKLALTQYVGWKEMGNYDDLVLANGTVFGPVYSFRSIFEKMEHCTADFWGITCHWGTKKLKAHIQTYFMVVHRKMHTSSIFKNYWENLPIFDSREEVIDKHEIKFTDYFSRHGFSWSVLVNPQNPNKVNDSDNSNLLFSRPCMLIRLMGCPVLKIRLFGTPVDISLIYADELRNSMTYIDKKTDYPIELIWQHILRKYPLSRLSESLNLCHVLPTASLSISEILEKILVVICGCNVHQLNFYCRILGNATENTFLLFFLKEDEEQLENYINLIDVKFAARVQIKNTMTIEGNIFSLLVEEKREFGYDYLCFLDAGKMFSHGIGDLDPVDFVLRNLLGDYDYIPNVLHLFQDNPRMGMAVSPVPCRDFTEGLCSDGEDGELEFDDAGFWIRGMAVQKILMDYPSLKNAPESRSVFSFPKILQKAGYYTGYILNSDMAVLEREYLNQLCFERNRMIRYVFPYHLFTKGERIVVYGAGNIGRAFCSQIKMYGDLEIVAIVDRDADNIKIPGMNVEKIQNLLNYKFDSVLISIKNEEIANSARKLLLSMGIKEKEIKWDGRIYEQNEYWKWYIERLRIQQGK